MPWKEISINELAISLGVNISEVREKQRLVQTIVRVRKSKGMSQASLAKKLNVTQSRIAQIESGVGMSKVSFDVLLSALVALGYDFKVITKKAA